MGHHHHHPHDHDHHHEELPEVLDTDVPDSELAPEDVSRRGMLRRAGLLGAGLAAGSVLTGGATAAASPDAGEGRSYDGHVPRGGYRWLAGDHHIHTQYSNDAKYRVVDHVRHANAYGLDWMVITDHGSVQHAKIGVERVNPDIVAARGQIRDTLVFQGLEWNIPAAEHGTVFVHPGQNEVAVLKEFENSFDGSVKGATAGTAANEALAISGVNFLADAVRRRRVQDALFLANHPARKGIDSPHEIRGWRDAQPTIAVGMEGAPGHQAAGIPAPQGPGSGRGGYDNSPSADSFPGYPLESYRTFGGFDWMTATVGGLWDSLLAEGKPWWITANSDSHNVYADSAVRGPNSDWEKNGFYNDPVYGGDVNTKDTDFWPGYYSRTHVGAANLGYAAVMDAIRAGRVWVDHGNLVSGLDVRLRARYGDSVTLGGALHVRRGTPVDLVISIDLANGPNWAGFEPALARVDVIQGAVTGPVADRDTMVAPATKVVKSFEVDKSRGTVRFTYSLGQVGGPLYVRLRGTDGKRSAVGLRGPAVDPSGPALDVLGNANPWQDLWFYTNPMWVLPGDDRRNRRPLTPARRRRPPGPRPRGQARSRRPGGGVHPPDPRRIPHIALSLDLPEVPTSLVEMARAGEFDLAIGPHGQATGAVEAVEAHAARTSGRAVIFPGSSTLTGSVSVATVLNSAVSAIAVLAGGEPPAGTDVIHTRDHVRPEWHSGVLTLTVSPVAPGEYAPFEVPNPTPCCADHG
ncbi:hypothetical protein GCM10029964_080190 [Kibdelosporangium lantanae]